MSLLPQRFVETSAAKLPVRVEVPAGLRRRVSVGTRVESRTRSVRARSVGKRAGHREWVRGVVVGYDGDLDLPLVAFDDQRGLPPEALTDDEYEVER